MLIKTNFLLLLIFCINLQLGFGAFRCYSCQGGYKSTCALTLPAGTWETCDGPNAHCYQSIKWFQNGAIKYVDRQCYRPPVNSTIKNYCRSFNNPNGQLKYCRTCTTDLCNGECFNPNYYNTGWYFTGEKCK